MHCLLPCSHVVKMRCAAQPALSLLCDQDEMRCAACYLTPMSARCAEMRCLPLEGRRGVKSSKACERRRGVKSTQRHSASHQRSIAAKIIIVIDHSLQHGLRRHIPPVFLFTFCEWILLHDFHLNSACSRRSRRCSRSSSRCNSAACSSCSSCNRWCGRGASGR
jgi:hypothetical protein